LRKYQKNLRILPTKSLITPLFSKNNNDLRQFLQRKLKTYDVFDVGRNEQRNRNRSTQILNKILKFELTPSLTTPDSAFVDVWAEKCLFLGGLQHFKLIFAQLVFLCVFVP